MTTKTLVPLAAGMLSLTSLAAGADVAGPAVHAYGHEPPPIVLAHAAPLRPAGDFGFYYRDRDGFFFGYDPRDGRRWYRDWRRQYYYERYYDHRKRRWLRHPRHYREWWYRHYRDWSRDHYRYRDHYRDHYRDEYRHRDRGRGRGHGRGRHHRDDD